MLVFIPIQSFNRLIQARGILLTEKKSKITWQYFDTSLQFLFLYINTSTLILHIHVCSLSIESPIFWIFYNFLYFNALCSWIILNMKSKESDVSAYLLHYTLLCRSAANKWKRQVPGPLCQKKARTYRMLLQRYFFA